jgi:hypothetical protein
MIRPLSHDGAGAMAVGTLWDLPFALAGRGALLRGRFSRRD